MSNNARRAYEAGVKLAQLNFMNKLSQDGVVPQLALSSDLLSPVQFGTGFGSTPDSSEPAPQIPSGNTPYYNPYFDAGRYVPGMEIGTPRMESGPTPPFSGGLSGFGDMIGGGLRGLYDNVVSYFRGLPDDQGTNYSGFQDDPGLTYSDSSENPEPSQSYNTVAQQVPTTAPAPRAPVPQAPAPRAPAPSTPKARAPVQQAPAPRTSRSAPASRRPAVQSLNQVMGNLPAARASAGTNAMLSNLRAARSGSAPRVKANPSMPNMRGMKMPEMVQMDPGARYR